MTTLARPFSELEAVEAADWATDIRIEAWRNLLATTAERRPLPLTDIERQWVVEDVLAAIVSHVQEYPGAGLEWFVCEGECDRLIAVVGDEEPGIVLLCDSCRDEAAHATEEFLHALIRRRQADDGPDETYRPTRLADVLSSSLRARIDAAEEEGRGLTAEDVRVIEDARIVSLSIDEHPNAFGGTLEVVDQEGPE